MLWQHLKYVLTFGEKCPPLVGQVNYDRPFMDHIGWEKDNISTKMKGKLRSIVGQV